MGGWGVRRAGVVCATCAGFGRGGRAGDGMLRLEVLGGIWLPAWLYRYLSIGFDEQSERVQRRQLVLNVSALLGGLIPLMFVIGFQLYDLRLWPASIVLAAMAVSNLSVPWIHQRSPSLATIWGGGFICVDLVAQTWLLGTASGLYLFLFVLPLIVLIVLGTAWTFHLLLSAGASILCMLICIFAIDEAALAVARDPILQTALMTAAVTGSSLMVFAAGYVVFFRSERAEDALEAAYARSEALLDNLLPHDIAQRLKAAPDLTIADQLPKVAIVFADIHGFTPRSAGMPPAQLVAFLNRVFNAFDALAEKHGLEKIKTIGDAYMAGAGLPRPCDRPVHRAAAMALDMLQAVRELSGERDAVEVRIGLHVGPVVAGVIGQRKPFYDAWGETVNTASRMEAYGQEGRVQVTAAVREELEDCYEFEPRGRIEVKGMGEVETWWLKEPEHARALQVRNTAD